MRNVQTKNLDFQNVKHRYLSCASIQNSIKKIVREAQK